MRVEATGFGASQKLPRYTRFDQKASVEYSGAHDDSEGSGNDDRESCTNVVSRDRISLTHKYF